MGRRSETRVLRWALDELAAGRGAVVELTGDPGIGKTRLLIELANDAARRGLAVLEGNATEFERDLPFQVFLDALGERYRSSGPGGGGIQAARWLAALFSGDGAPGTGAERFRVYGAVRDLLSGWADDGLALLLDDMHWADPGAIELASYLVRHPPPAPLLLVLSLRRRQSPARLDGVLSRGVELGSVVRVDLGPLSPAESAELVGPGVDDRSRREICDESGGNPLYLLAVTASKKAGTAPGAAGNAPNRLETVLLAELVKLTEQERLVAAAAAVVGEQFRMDALPAVAGLGQGEAEHAISGLAKRDVLRTAPNAAMLVFRHPVLRNVIYRNVDPAWRLAAHRRALAELTRRAAPATELAHHVAAAGGHEPGDLEILQQAARAAMSSAPATAAEWLGIALQAVPDDAAHAAQRLKILLLITRALGVAGKLSRSRDLLHEILRRVPIRPPGPRVAAVAFCATMERLLARYPEARALLAAELATPRAAATGNGVDLAIEYGTVALMAADFPSARGHLSTALARARRRHDKLREASALAISAFGEVYEGNTEAAGALADSAAELVDGMSDSVLSDDAECMSKLGWAEVFLERFADADRHFSRGVAITRHIGHYHVLPHLLLGRGQLSCWTGPLARAMELSEEAEEIAHHIDGADVLGLSLAMRAFAATWTDGPDDTRAVTLAEQATAIIPESSAWWARVAGTYLALALVLNGEPARALHVMTTTGGGPGLPLIQPSKRPSCLDIVTAAAVLSGDNATAREAAKQGAAESRRLGLAGQRGFAMRSLAFVYSSEGRHDEAIAAFRAATDMQVAAGMRVSAALTLALAAQGAAAVGRAETAASLAAEATTLARAVGALKIEAMAAGPLAAAGPPATAGALPANGAGNGPLAALTDREREIARLASTGRTSREIAAQLYLSPRTVESHLTHIYRKLGLSSRAALASLIATSSLS